MPIAGTNGCFQISNLGNAYSFRGALFKSARNRKPWVTTGGYLCTDIIINEDRFTRKVHRLVAEAFLPNPKNYRVVNHMDGNKLNNCVGNLEWCDHSHNNQHAWDTGLNPKKYGGDNPLLLLTWEQADELRELKKAGIKRKELAERFGVSIVTVDKIVGNRQYVKKSA